jgi:translation initiation factor IF-1
VVVVVAANTAVAVAVAIATNHQPVISRRGSGEPDSAVFISLTMKEDHIEVEGCVKVVLPGTMFRVELDNKHLVLATICGKMRKRWVRLTAGDRVRMEMSPYDLDKARITWRLR